MLTLEEIREIACHQRLRGVEVAGLRRNQDSLRIRISAAVPSNAADARHCGPANDMKVRSGSLGTLVLSGRPDLPRTIGVGDRVEKGQTLAFIELEDSVSAVPAPAHGIVTAVLVQPGQRADYGMPLFEITPAQGDLK